MSSMHLHLVLHFVEFDDAEPAFEQGQPD